MSATPPPIQDSGNQCPNCGAYKPAGQGYCANCGYGRPAPQSSTNTGMQVLALLLLILIGLPAGCLGACFLFMPSSGSAGPEMGYRVIGLVGIFLLILLIFFTVKSFTRRK